MLRYTFLSSFDATFQMKLKYFTKLLTALTLWNAALNFNLVANAQELSQPVKLESEEVELLQAQQNETENLEEPPESISTTTIVINEEQLEKILTNITSEPQLPWHKSPSFYTTIAGGFVSILGTIVGGLITFCIFERNRTKSKKDRDGEREQERDKAKIELTYQVMKEWDSYREERVKADDIFVIRLRKEIENSGENISDESIYEKVKPFHEIPHEERLYMNRILDFFDRLNILKEKELINKDLASRYFTLDYTQWWDNYIKFQKGFADFRGKEDDPDYIPAFNNLPDDWLLDYDWLLDSKKSKEIK